MREGKALIRELNFRQFEPVISAILAEVEAEAGHLEEGLLTLDAQFAGIENTGQRWFDAEVQRVRGELLLRREPSAVGMAEAAFTRAVEIAQNQQTRTFELRAALSLAKLYRSTGRNSGVRELLVAAVAGFVEGPEVPEVAAVNRLLKSLNESPGLHEGQGDPSALT
jgi:predicted ATPase